MSDSKVGILLVLYNSKGHLDVLIDSIKSQKNKNFSLYAISCNSERKEEQYLKKIFPSAVILPSMGNIGFAKANNTLAKQALEDGCEYLFVINPDMELSENTIEVFYNLMKSESNIGACSSVLLFGDGKKDANKIQLFGQQINFSTQNKKMLFANELLELANLPDKMEIDFVNAGSLFIRSEVVNEVGLFNEDFFMYNDEIDLAYRMKKTMYKILVTSDTKIWHHHNWSKSNKKSYYFMYYYMMRNRVLFFKDHSLYRNLVIDIVKQILSLPIKVKWLTRLAGIKLVKYYYLGLWRGLLGEVGKSVIKFK